MNHRRGINLGIRAMLGGAVIGGLTMACGSSPTGDSVGELAQAEGTCAPNQEPNEQGVCVPCSGVPLVGELSVAAATSLFDDLDVQAASYTVSENNAKFNPSPNFAIFGVTIPSGASPVTIPTISGSTSGVNYQIVIQDIHTMNATWGAWQVAPSGVTVPATLSGNIAAHVTAEWGPFSPGSDITVTISGLPVFITFGSDGAGNATVSSVVINDFDQDVSISGCSLAGIDCSGLVSSFLSSAEPDFQSFVGSQFGKALNSGGPFWQSLMVSVANKGLALVDQTGRGLTAVGTPTANGAPTGYSFEGMAIPPPANASGAPIVAAANLFENGVCMIDCTPLTVAQACAHQQCGTASDGCMNTVQCPNLCGSGLYCEAGENVCVGLDEPCDPRCPTGYICEWPNGPIGVCVVDHFCSQIPHPQHYCNGRCVPGTGPCP